MKKTCENCKHQEKKIEEEPCVHCGTPGKNFDDYNN